MITFTRPEFSGVMFIWFAVIIGAAYSAGMIGYHLGRRDREEDGPGWDEESLRAVREDPPPDSSWLYTVPLAALVRDQPPLEGRVVPRALDRATDVIAALTAETDAYIASMQGK